MELEKAIEAVLFYKAAPVEKTALAQLFKVGEEEVSAALKALGERLKGGATALILTAHEAELAVAPEYDELIDGIRKDELRRDIGRAGAETLAIVLYRAPIARAEIDRLRGVNSSYILRSLEARGLVERRSKGQRSEFWPTTELLRHLGIREKTEMPDYVTVMGALDKFEDHNDNE